MSYKLCPICCVELQKVETTPCMSCGAVPDSLKRIEEFDYKEYELFFEQKLILCNFCEVDFGSQDPTYLGFESNKDIGLGTWAFVKDIPEKEIHMDKYCPNCNHRLAYLKFVKICREKNNKAPNKT